MSNRAGLLERGYAYLGIIFYEQGIIQALRAARGEDGLRPGGSDVVSTVTQTLLLLGLLAILTWRWRQFLPLARHALLYAAIVALCLASTIWSDNPLQTFRRGMSLLTCALLGLYLAQSFGLSGAIAMVGRSAVFLGLLSIAVFIAVPSIGRETAFGYENAMRGVFPQKNPMAECMLLGVTCYAFRLLDEGIRSRHLACVCILLVCIALGRSATSLGVSLLVLSTAAFMGLRQHPRLRLLLGFGTGWVILAITVMALAAPELLFKAAGRDASLTGRGPLWHEVMGVIAERPILGHGYSGFWNEDSREVQYLWLKAGWRAPDSHNGYLDVLVELGPVGLILYLAAWSRVLRWAVAAWRAGAVRESRWIVLFMLTNIVLNLDEGPMPYPNEFSMLMPAALATLSLWHNSVRVHAAQHRARPMRAALHLTQSARP